MMEMDPPHDGTHPGHRENQPEKYPPPGMLRIRTEDQRDQSSVNNIDDQYHRGLLIHGPNLRSIDLVVDVNSHLLVRSLERF